MEKGVPISSNERQKRIEVDLEQIQRDINSLDDQIKESSQSK